MTAIKDAPCATPEDVINVRCLQCGEVTTGAFTMLAECRHCGALDFHVFRGFVSLTDGPPRRAVEPDNRNVINEIIDLVQRKTS